MNTKSLKKAGSAVIASAMLLNTSVFGGGSVSAEETKYEFESGTITGTTTIVTDEVSGFSGDGYVFLKDAGDTLEIEVEVPETDNYDLIVNYNLPASSGSKTQYIYINGTNKTEIVFSPTAGFSEKSLGNFNLQKGKNTIKIESFWGWTMFDYLKIGNAKYPALMASKKLCDEKASPEACSLMNYLVDCYGNKIISGQQEFYGVSRDTEFDYIYELCGDYPAIRGFDFGETCPLFYWDAKTSDRAISWVKDKGGIATASWHVNVPTKMENYTLGSTMPFNDTTYSEKTDFVTANVMVEGTVEHDYFLLAVDNLAKELQKLEDANVPLLFRPFHEAEGNGGSDGSGAWFWWAKEGSEVYKELYIYLYELLTEKYDIHNLIWEFNSYVYDNSYDWYPGEEYVDIVGYDKYNAKNYSTGQIAPNESAISSIFYKLVNMYNQHGNPIAMMENDTVPSLKNLTSEKAAWLYFCIWYDNGSENFVSGNSYQNSETLKEVYESDYCITLSELPDDLYTQEVTEDPIPVVTTTADPNQSTTTPVPTFELTKYNIDLSGRGDSNTIYLTFEGTPDAYTNGCVGYAVGKDWFQIKWEATLDAKGKATVAVDISEIPAGTASAEAQIWWAATADEKIAKNVLEDYGFTVSEDTLLYGDANDNGEIEVADAVFILQGLADPSNDEFTLSDKGSKQADCHKNGNGVDTEDALAVLQFKATIIDTLPYNPE